jgi:hypothetical protein
MYKNIRMQSLAAALLVAASLPAAAGTLATRSDAAPSLMLQSALQVLRYEHRADLQAQLRGERQRLWAAASLAPRMPDAPLLAGHGLTPALRCTS